MGFESVLMRFFPRVYTEADFVKRNTGADSEFKINDGNKGLLPTPGC